MPAVEADNGDTDNDGVDGADGDDDEVLVALEGYLLCPEKLAGGLRWEAQWAKVLKYCGWGTS